MLKKLLLYISVSFILTTNLYSKENKESSFENIIDTEFLYIKKSNHIVDVKLTASTITKFSNDKMKKILWQVLRSMVLNVCKDLSDIDKIELLDNLIIKKEDSTEVHFKYTQIMTVSCVKPINKKNIF